MLAIKSRSMAGRSYLWPVWATSTGFVSPPVAPQPAQVTHGHRITRTIRLPREISAQIYPLPRKRGCTCSIQIQCSLGNMSLLAYISTPSSRDRLANVDILFMWYLQG